MTKLRVAFMGTPDFAVPALAKILEAGHEVVAVYTQPPRPAGRGNKLKKSAVQLFAEEHHLDVRHPKTLRTPEAQKDFQDLALDVAVVAAYGLILPPAILEAPKAGCINIHGSLLPRWRGAAPIHRALLAGDTETGITIMQMDVGLDTGDMLIKGTTAISDQDTSQTIHDRLSAMGGELIVEALDQLVDGSLQAEEQPEEGVTYAHKLDRADGQLDFTRPASYLDRQVRALNPWPGVWFDLENNGLVERIKVKAIEIEQDDQEALPGTLLDKEMRVACSDGVVKLALVQRPGKSAVTGDAFLRGFPVELGSLLTKIDEK